MSRISIFRTSFIWTEATPDLLSTSTFLGDYGTYATTFATLKADPSGELRLPWNVPQGDHFWKHYFEGSHAGDAKPRMAWRKAVPFRAELGIATTSPEKPDLKFTLELFYTAFSVSVVASANYRGAARSPAEIAKAALDARYDYLFRLADEPTANPVSLEAIAGRALTSARQRMMPNLPGAMSAGPFSVTTFLQAEEATPITQGSDEHLLLETVTGWKSGLTSASLAALPLADACLKTIRGTDAENVVYARDDGRAIWFPREFVNNKKPKLRCYHRNIVHASLQAQSIGLFVSWVAGQKALNRTIDGAVREHAKQVAVALDLLANGGTPNYKATYRSASVVQQITKANWAADIKVVKDL